MGVRQRGVVAMNALSPNEGFQPEYQMSSFALCPISYSKNPHRRDAKAATTIIWPFHLREPAGAPSVLMPAIAQK